jgi:phosphate-selective porin OprO/OprP
MNRLRAIGFAVACLALLCPRGAAAQTAAAPVTAGFDNGFFIQSADGDTRLLVGMNLQVDGRFSLDDPAPIVDTFLIRKFRPTFSGRIAKYFDFKLMPDFGNGTASVQDAWLDTRFANGFRLRIGKDKIPVGYELMIGDSTTYFPERALATTLVPTRDVGVQALGDLAAGRVSYSAGVYNGVPDGTSGTGDVDSNNGKDIAGRVVLQPFRASRNEAIRGLGIHVGGSAGTQAGALPSFRTSAGQVYFAYAPGSTADGEHTRMTPAAFYFYKSFGAFTEYVLSSQEVTRNGATYPLDNHAMEATVSWYLTGEPGGIGQTRPKRPFDPAAGHWGAAQVVARFSHLEIDGGAFVAGLAAPGASRRADQWTIGFNWFPTSFTKWYATYERTTFDQNAAGARPVENVIIMRAQIAF